MRFTYEGPFDAVDVILTVKRGESVDVPDGAGLLAQHLTWTPDKKALGSLTVDALHERAAQVGVEVPASAKKDDLVTALAAFSPNPRDTTTEEG